jgi:predicted nucleotidyltransferase
MSERAPDPELVKAFARAVRQHFADDIEREGKEAEQRRNEIVPIVRESVAKARAERLCTRAWLFGSYAWGRPGERSDVDVLVEHCKDPLELASLIGRACQRDVHVIDWSEAPESLRERVTLEGVVL